MLWIPLTLFGIMVPPVVTLSVFQATNAELPGWLQDVQTAGVIGMFVMLFFCLLTKRLVMGWTYDAMVTERDYYRGIAYKTTELADRQVSTEKRCSREWILWLSAVRFLKVGSVDAMKREKESTVPNEVQKLQKRQDRIESRLTFVELRLGIKRPDIIPELLGKESKPDDAA